MNFVQAPLLGVFTITPRIFSDERGFFMESWKESSLREAGIDTVFIQDNHSKSSKGVLRGMHFQTRKPQAKLVRVVRGAVYDVVIDCRKGSSTYGKRYGEILSAENKKQLYVPIGCAHGFLTLEDNTEFLYKVSDVYDAGGEGGVMWNDPVVGIDRQTIFDTYSISDVVLSEKDTHYSSFDQLPDDLFSSFNG